MKLWSLTSPVFFQEKPYSQKLTNTAKLSKKPNTLCFFNKEQVYKQLALEWQIVKQLSAQLFFTK